eukprot:snap_masked-scaffold_31-processed-gene-2.29-mRNA-1 protein AED:1.00 eAED:1.00 QI:0/-1/0/0/-1/1/1/0/626
MEDTEQKVIELNRLDVKENYESEDLEAALDEDVICYHLARIATLKLKDTKLEELNKKTLKQLLDKIFGYSSNFPSGNETGHQSSLIQNFGWLERQSFGYDAPEDYYFILNKNYMNTINKEIYSRQTMGAFRVIELIDPFTKGNLFDIMFSQSFATYQRNLMVGYFFQVVDGEVKTQLQYTDYFLYRFFHWFKQFPKDFFNNFIEKKVTFNRKTTLKNVMQGNVPLSLFYRYLLYFFHHAKQEDKNRFLEIFHSVFFDGEVPNLLTLQCIFIFVKFTTKIKYKEFLPVLTQFSTMCLKKIEKEKFNEIVYFTIKVLEVWKEEKLFQPKIVHEKSFQDYVSSVIQYLQNLRKPKKIKRGDNFVIEKYIHDITQNSELFLTLLKTSVERFNEGFLHVDDVEAILFMFNTVFPEHVLDIIIKSDNSSQSSKLEKYLCRKEDFETLIWQLLYHKNRIIQENKKVLSKISSAFQKMDYFKLIFIEEAPFINEARISALVVRLQRRFNLSVGDISFLQKPARTTTRKIPKYEVDHKNYPVMSFELDILVYALQKLSKFLDMSIDLRPLGDLRFISLFIFFSFWVKLFLIEFDLWLLLNSITLLLTLSYRHFNGVKLFGVLFTISCLPRALMIL